MTSSPEDACLIGPTRTSTAVTLVNTTYGSAQHYCSTVGNPLRPPRPRVDATNHTQAGTHTTYAFPSDRSAYGSVSHLHNITNPSSPSTHDYACHLRCLSSASFSSLLTLLALRSPAFRSTSSFHDSLTSFDYLHTAAQAASTTASAAPLRQQATA